MRSDRITSFFLQAFALFFCVLSYRLGMGSLRDPGPGFIPFFSGILLAGLSLAIFMRSVIRKEEASSFGKGWKKGLWVTGSLLIYVLILESMGFIVTTFFFLMLSTLSFQPRRWTGAFLLSLLTVIISYLIFSVWLKVQLPIGLLGI